MADKLLNVLDEIKRLKVTRAPKSNIYIHPNKYDMNKHATASSVKLYTTKLYGNEGKHFNINDSHYKDSIFAGFTGRIPNQEHFKHAPEKATTNYMNKLYGIPDVKEFSNNDNTLYYEKKLGNKSELDYAVENFDDAEMNPETILSENDKAYNLNKLKTVLNNHRINKSTIKASVAPQVAAAKALKASIKNPPISSRTPSNVMVGSAFSTPLPSSITVNPVVITTPLSKGESNLQNLANKLKAANTIKTTMRRKYDIKRYDASKQQQQEQTPAVAAVTRSQTDKSDKTPRTPIPKKKV